MLKNKQYYYSYYYSYCYCCCYVLALLHLNPGSTPAPLQTARTRNTCQSGQIHRHE